MPFDDDLGHVDGLAYYKPNMRFRAIAMASERSNAVGTVELECLPEGLALVYLQASPFAPGFVPSHQTQNEAHVVPWRQILEASVDGDQVFLALDPKVGPLSRLCLVNFSSGNTTHHHALYRRRLLVRIATAGAAVSFALIASAAALRLAPGTTGASALGIAVVTALVLIALGSFADQALKSGGVEGSLAREGFVTELMTFVPNLLRSAHAPRAPRPDSSPLLLFQGFLPRTTAAIVITLSAVTLGFVLTVRWLLTSDPAHELAAHAARTGIDEPSRGDPTSPSARAAARGALRVDEHEGGGIPAAVPHSISSIPEAADRKSGDAASAGAPPVPCRCRRSDSLLWREPIPVLSILTLSKRTRRGRKEDERADKNYLDLDIGVVNNSKEPRKDIALLVEFFEHDPPPSNKRYQTATRPLFFEGPLAPAQAIKWDVEARGRDFEVHSAVTGDLGSEGENAAPTNLLVELLRAHNRPVRLHGAMLLTFFGDPRAKDAILELREALREDESPYLDRLLHAASELRVCALHVDGGGETRSVRACVFNAGSSASSNLGLRVRGLNSESSDGELAGAPPDVLSEGTIAVPFALTPDTGAVVSGQLTLGAARPSTFEAFADRIDLLPR